MKPTKRIFLVFIITLGLINVAEAQTCFDYSGSIVHASDYAVADVSCTARMGDFLLFGTETGQFLVVDISDPVNPTPKGSLNLGAGVKYIRVSGGLAYVAAGVAGLSIVEVPVSGVPLILGSYDTAGSAHGVVVVGTMVYVADYGGGLVILNAADPATPALVGTVASTGSIDSVEHIDNYFVVRTYYGTNPLVDGVQVYDLSDPLAAVVTDEVLGYNYDVNYNWSYRGIHAIGSDLYITSASSYKAGGGPFDPTCYNKGVSHKAISPEGLFVSLNGMSFPTDVYTSKPCLLGGDGGVLAVDRIGEVILFDADTMVEIGVVKGVVSSSSTHVRPLVSGDILVRAIGDPLGIHQLGPTFGDVLLQRTDIPSNAFEREGVSVMAGDGLVVSGVYVQNPDDFDPGGFYFKVYSVNGSGLVDFDWSWSIPSYGPGEFMVAGFTPTAVLLNSTGALYVIDFSSHGIVAGPFGHDALATAGNLVFIANTVGAEPLLQIHDLTDPTAPLLLSTLPVADNCRGIAVDGTMVHLWYDSPQVTVVDVSDLSAPALVGQAVYPHVPLQLVFDGGFSYTIWDVSGTRELAVLDSGSPLSPVILGSIEIPNDCTRVAPRDNLVYLGSNSLGVTVVDVTSPAVPEIEGSYLPGLTTALAVSDDIIVASYNRGLSVLAPSCSGVVSGVFPALLSFFDITTREGRVTITWGISEYVEDGEFRLTAQSDGRTWEVPVKRASSGFSASDEITATGDVTYLLQMLTPDGWDTLADETVSLSMPTPVLTLEKPWPNPFNPLVKIAFSLRDQGLAKLAVYDLKGRCVAVLIDAELHSGPHATEWSGTDSAGRKVPAGTYAIRLTTAAGVRVEKVTLLK
ncbi:MAG: hypothetical protein ABFS42_10580 [Candidatus Krumholzibacteriota bacterium]